MEHLCCSLACSKPKMQHFGTLQQRLDGVTWVEASRAHGGKGVGKGGGGEGATAKWT